MPSVLKHQVHIPALSGVTADDVTNSFHSLALGLVPTALELATVHDAIVSFYNAGNAGGDTVGHYISSTHSRALDACVIKSYIVATDAGGGVMVPTPQPRVPVGLRLFTLAATNSAQSHASEVAICVTFTASLQNNALDRRRRGRIFLGPLITGTGAGGNTFPAQPVTQTVTDITTAATRMLDMADGGANPSALVVYSKTAARAYTITGGWVDNAYDTQQRRGIRSSARTFFTTP